MLIHLKIIHCTVTYFMKNNYIFQNKKITWWEEWDCFTFSQSSVTCGLVEDSWILTSCSALILFYQVLVGINDILVSHGYIAGQGRSILIDFSDNCGYSLRLHPNPTSGSSLKVSWNVEFETIINKLFLLFYIKIYWSMLLSE